MLNGKVQEKILVKIIHKPWKFSNLPGNLILMGQIGQEYTEIT